MNFSEVFIRRPIATSLLMAALTLFGVVAYLNLPVSDMPDVEMPTLQVQANLTGADPATMASSVATVLERQFTTIAGVDSMRSSSSTGQTQITLQFDSGRATLIPALALPFSILGTLAVMQLFGFSLNRCR